MLKLSPVLAFALCLFSLTPTQSAASSPGGAKDGSTFYGFYVLQALTRSGDADSATTARTAAGSSHPKLRI